MKRISVIFFGIADIFYSNKALFVLMLVGVFASNFMMAYFFGNFSVYLNDQSVSTNVGYPVSNDFRLNIDEIEDIDTEGFDVRCICLMHTLGQEAALNIKNEEGTAILDDIGASTHLSIRAFSDNDLIVRKYFGKVEFDNENKYSIILPITGMTGTLSYDEEKESYGNITLEGITFKIIGVSTYRDVAIIPYEAFNEIYTANQVTYYTNSLLSVNQSEAFVRYLKEKFGSTGNFLNPYSYYKAAQRKYPEFLVVIVTAYIVSMITFIFYVNYFLEKGMRRSAISRLCGASTNRLICDMVIMNILITSVSFIFSVITYLIFGNLLNIFSGAFLNFKYICHMYIINFVSTVLLSIPAIAKMVRTSSVIFARVTE